MDEGKPPQGLTIATTAATNTSNPKPNNHQQGESLHPPSQHTPTATTTLATNQQRQKYSRENQQNHKRAKTHHEHVVGVGELSSSLEQLDQIIELTMDVSADGDGAADGLHVALL